MGGSGAICIYVMKLLGKHINDKSFFCKTSYNLPDLKYEKRQCRYILYRI